LSLPGTPAGTTGAYHGPDLQTALKLVARSGTTGTRITVVGTRPLGAKGAAARDLVSEYFAHVLRTLRYQVNYRTVKDYDYVADSRNRVQIGAPQGWGADFPAPANFYNTLLSCRSFVPNGAAPGNYNVSEYCNPKLDALAQAALAAQTSNPAQARALWASVDRQVTNAAPWVATTNPEVTVMVSARVRNYQSNAMFGPILDQLWIH
jgi:ABC-type transport system substrate-binding protein